MPRALAPLFQSLSALFTRIMRSLKERNDRQIELWSTSLQHKRRYTHPETLKRYRSEPVKSRGQR